MTKTTRTSISVPVELKLRMIAFDQDVNWSAIACRAFEDRLRRAPPDPAELGRLLMTFLTPGQLSQLMDAIGT